MMLTIDTLSSMLGWGILINYALLMIWFLVFLLAHDWLYRLHSMWFNLPAASFDAMHYAGMALYKLGIFLFFLAPWLALWING